MRKASAKGHIEMKCSNGPVSFITLSSGRNGLCHRFFRNSHKVCVAITGVELIIRQSRRFLVNVQRQVKIYTAWTLMFVVPNFCGVSAIHKSWLSRKWRSLVAHPWVYIGPHKQQHTIKAAFAIRVWRVSMAPWPEIVPMCSLLLLCSSFSMARDCTNATSFSCSLLLLHSSITCGCFLQCSWFLPSLWPEIVPMQHLPDVHCYCFTLLSHVDASSDVLNSCFLHGQRLYQCNIFLMFTATASLFYHMWMLQLSCFLLSSFCCLPCGHQSWLFCLHRSLKHGFLHPLQYHYGILPPKIIIMESSHLRSSNPSLICMLRWLFQRYWVLLANVMWWQ